MYSGWSGAPWTPARPGSRWAARSGGRRTRPGWSALSRPSSATAPASMKRLASWPRGGRISSLADASAFDVVVIGGGGLGTAVAPRLAETTPSVGFLGAADHLA